MLTFLRYNLWAILWGAFIVTLTILPGKFVPDFPAFLDLFKPDKVIHLVVFFVYFLLQNHSFKRQPSYPWIARHSGAMTLLVCFMLAAGTELMQHYIIPMRNGSVYDFIANIAGCLPGYLVVRRKKEAGMFSNDSGNSGR